MALLLLLLLSTHAALGALTPDRVDLVFVATSRQAPAALILRLRRGPGDEADTQRYVFEATSWLDRSSSNVTAGKLQREQHQLTFQAQPGLDSWPAREGYSFQWHSDGGLEVRLGQPHALLFMTDPISSKTAQGLTDETCLRDRVAARMSQAGRSQRGWAQIEICARAQKPRLLQAGHYWLAVGGRQLQAGSLLVDRSTSLDASQFEWLAGIATQRRRWPQAVRVVTPQGLWILQRFTWKPMSQGTPFNPVREAILLSSRGGNGSRWDRASALVLPLVQNSPSPATRPPSPVSNDAGTSPVEDAGQAPLATP